MRNVLNKFKNKLRYIYIIAATLFVIALGAVTMREPVLEIDHASEDESSARHADTYAEDVDYSDYAMYDEELEEEETDEEDPDEEDPDEETPDEEAADEFAEGDAYFAENETDDVVDPALPDQVITGDETDGEGSSEVAGDEPTDPSQSEDVDPAEPQDLTDPEAPSDTDGEDVTDVPEETVVPDSEQTDESAKKADSATSKKKKSGKKHSDKKKKDNKKPTAKKPVKIDTSKTDSTTDAAPSNMNLPVRQADVQAVVSVPSAPVSVSSLSAPRKRAASQYAETLLDDYKVEFSSDFAIIMEEIEDEFEYEHGLISKKTLEQRQKRLDRGVVFGLDESSAYAKASEKDESLFMTEQEAELCDLYLRQQEEDTEESERVAESSIALSSYHYTNWPDILAIYASRQKKAGAKTVKYNKKAKDAIAKLFADMNEVEILTDEEGHETTIAEWTNLSVTDYLAERHENGKEARKLRRLLKHYISTDYLMMCAVETGSRQLTLAAIDAQDQERMKEEVKKAEEEGLTEEEAALTVTPISDTRKAVVLSAQTLNGKVHYFWGGKYNSFGWNRYWATPQTVTSAGSSDTGQTMPYGLDCSGFVSWSFVNGLDNRDAGLSIGQGTASQWVTSEAISDEDAQVGDLVFLRVPSAGSINHVGILIGRDEDGNWLAIHCNASDDNVAVDRAYDAGFRYLRRPLVYGDAPVLTE